MRGSQDWISKLKIRAFHFVLFPTTPGQHPGEQHDDGLYSLGFDRERLARQVALLNRLGVGEEGRDEEISMIKESLIAENEEKNELL